MSHSSKSSVSSAMSVSAPLLAKNPIKQEHDEHPEYFLPATQMHSKYRRRPPVTLLCIVTCIGLLTAVFTLFWSRGDVAVPVPATPDDIHAVNNVPELVEFDEIAIPDHVPEHSEVIDAEPSQDPAWRAKVAQWLKGEPTEHFQDNLRDDMQYLTTWTNGGWTNDFMTFVNMIYLGIISSRTPIIPPFAPSHVDYDAGFPPFGDIFDVPRLSAAINTPLLEFRDIKRENSSAMDQLGCWSIWGLVGTPGEPRGSFHPRHLKLDVSYTMLPKGSTDLIQPASLWVPFWALAQLGFPERRAEALNEHPPQTPAPESGVLLPPDERALCFDFMYYIGASRHHEWWLEWSPAWRFVGQHARWTAPLEGLARQYVQRALGAKPNDKAFFPPYIGVHVRRGDFSTSACGSVPKDDCLPPLTTYVRRVAEVRAKILERKGLFVPPENVLVTSDETDPQWWDDVRSVGWRWADHAAEQTATRYGKWYLPLIDAVVQSMGVGFVGTHQSTMSLVAQRRVEYWHKGVAYLVKMGYKDADAH